MDFGCFLTTTSLITAALIVRTIGFSWLAYELLYRRRNSFHKFNVALPDERAVREERRITLRNTCQLVFWVAAIVALYQLGATRLYVDLDAYSIFYTPLSIVLIAVIQDGYFFAIHALMHSRFGRWTGHNVHHRFHNPTPWAAYAMSGVEFHLQNLFYLLVVLVLPIHPIVLAVYLTFSYGLNVVGHSGFRLWKSAGDFAGSSEVHYLHHRHVKVNYSLYFTHWDRCFGSYRAPVCTEARAVSASAE